MNGEFLHDNRLLDGVTFSSGAATWTLPLENALDHTAMIARPARCITPAAAVIRMELAAPTSLSRWLLAHITASLSSTYTIKASSTSAHSGDILDVPPSRIWGRVVSSIALPWTDSGWWRGLARAKDMERYARHLYIRHDRVKAQYWEIVISDSDPAATYLDVGWMIATQPVLIQFNYDLGRRRGRRHRSVVEETAGGALVVDRRPAARRHDVAFSLLSAGEAAQIYDMVQARGIAEPVVFVPEPDTHRDAIRDIWPARMTSAGEVVRAEQDIWTVALSMEEVTA